MDSVSLMLKLIAVTGVVSTVLVLIAAGLAIRTLWRAAGRAAARLRVAREVRNLDYGTCDGLPPRRIRYLVNELWCIDDPARRD